MLPVDPPSTQDKIKGSEFVTCHKVVLLNGLWLLKGRPQMTSAMFSLLMDTSFKSGVHTQISWRAKKMCCPYQRAKLLCYPYADGAFIKKRT